MIAFMENGKPIAVTSLEVTDEMVKRAHRAYFDDPDGPSEVEAACMRNALVAAFQDKGASDV